MTGWDAKTYPRFADERTQPAVDLAARIKLAAPKHIIDLGCGPGNSTEVLRRRWPEDDRRCIDITSPWEMGAGGISPGGWLKPHLISSFPMLRFNGCPTTVSFFLVFLPGSPPGAPWRFRCLLTTVQRRTERSLKWLMTPPGAIS